MYKKISTIVLVFLFTSSMILFFSSMEVSGEDGLPTTDYIMIENTTARPDTEGLVIPVYGNTSQNLSRFLIRLTVDVLVVEITDLNFDDCVAVPSEYSVILSSDGQYHISIHYDDGLLPLGEGRFFNLIANIITDESLTFTTYLEFDSSWTIFFDAAGALIIPLPEKINGHIEIINNPPPTPGIPTGETYCLQGGTYQYEMSSVVDPDGDTVKYKFDWGDGNVSSRGSRKREHRWFTVGEFQIRGKARDKHGAESNWSTELNVIVVSAPPYSPSRPEGPTNGETGEELCFTTNTTDPQGDNLYYKWDFGENITDWLGPYDSDIEVEECHIWTSSGTYQIRVKAKNIYGAESEWSSNLTVNITSPLPELFIDTDLKVVENAEFILTVTQKDTRIAIEYVDVLFNGVIIQTDNNGQVTFTAPPVDQSAGYTILVSYEGYRSTSITITVLNQKERKGWIWGLVTDNSGEIIKDASVCAILSDEGTTSECTFTDEQGRYHKQVLIGTYTVEASKEGYESSSEEGITVSENVAVEVNFVLTKLENYTEPTPDENQELIDEAIKAGNIGGETRYQKIDDEIRSEEIIYAQVTIVSQIITEENTISVVVSSDEEIGKTFLFTFDKSSFDRIEDLKFDGEAIELASDLSDVLDPTDDNGVAEYFIIESSQNDIIVLVSVPSFSDHTITIIYQIVDVLGGPIAIILYVVILIVALSFFVAPLDSSFNRLIKFYQKKKR